MSTCNSRRTRVLEVFLEGSYDLIFVKEESSLKPHKFANPWAKGSHIHQLWVSQRVLWQIASGPTSASPHKWVYISLHGLNHLGAHHSLRTKADFPTSMVQAHIRDCGSPCRQGGGVSALRDRNPDKAWKKSPESLVFKAHFRLWDFGRKGPWDL